MTEVEAYAIARNSPEIWAFAHQIDALLNLPEGERRIAAIRSIVEYDRFRNEEIESLKTRLRDALMWSVKPMTIAKSPATGELKTEE